MVKDAGFEFLEHTADVWARAWGSTIESAIEQAAAALLSTIGNPEKAVPKIDRVVEIQAPDLESLVVELLTEVLYYFDAEGLFFHSLKVDGTITRQSEFGIKATLAGEHFDPARHEPDTEVKAITYSYLVIKEEPGRALIEIVFDI